MPAPEVCSVSPMPEPLSERKPKSRLGEKLEALIELEKLRVYVERNEIKDVDLGLIARFLSKFTS